MSKYLYDEKGNRYVKENDSNEEMIGMLIVFGLALIIAFAPGMVLTSLIAMAIDTTLWAWIWSILFSAGIFFLVYWGYMYNTQLNYPWRWIIVTYLILSGLSVWVLFASEADCIVRICNLLMGKDL